MDGREFREVSERRSRVPDHSPRLLGSRFPWSDGFGSGPSRSHLDDDDGGGGTGIQEFPSRLWRERLSFPGSRLADWSSGPGPGIRCSRSPIRSDGSGIYGWCLSLGSVGFGIGGVRSRPNGGAGIHGFHPRLLAFPGLGSRRAGCFGMEGIRGWRSRMAGIPGSHPAGIREVRSLRRGGVGLQGGCSRRRGI